MPGIVGIVALLGSVYTDSLSRMLAEYLDEDLMLAVVCKSYASARCLEKYESGELVPPGGLHILAAELGSTINCGFLAICLEDLRPYRGESKSNDPQKKLALLDPIGETPSGFLKYTINMDFGTRKQMNQAHGCIKETGLYHLDGGIVVLGPQKEPKVRFPVVNSESHLPIDPHIDKKLEEKKLESGEMLVELAKVSK